MVSNKKIIRRSISQESMTAFSGLPTLLQRIYAGRNISSHAELERELTSLHPYTALKHIEQAAQFISSAIMKNQKILIVGDFDADGATSTALAMKALKMFGATHARFRVPNRFADGYGLTPELVLSLSENERPDLLITVDNGIANHAGVIAAKNLGITVIITDHHLPAKTLPAADAIVNPNQPGDQFPSKNLAGVGVIFYVMLAVRKCLLNKNWFNKLQCTEPNMAQLLDLVALGTVADLVPLDHTNRILVHQGIRRIRGGRCAPAIVALLECAKRDFTHIVAADLGFAVAARLNAAGRLDDMSLGIECLLTEDPLKSREMASILDQLNDERRSIEQDMQIQAIDALNTLHNQLQGELPKGLCLFDEGWHQGVIGILAARIKDRYHRPVIVFAPGVDGQLKGSARSIAGLHIRDILALMDTSHPQLIDKFGGHAMAAGLTIARSVLTDFEHLFNATVAQHLSDAHLQQCLLSDGELLPSELTLQHAELLRDGGPWGQAFPEPLFDNIFTIVDQRLVGEKHLKLRLQKDDVEIDGIAFFIDKELWPNQRCQRANIAYRLDINQFRNQRQVQIIIEHIQPIS